MCTSVAQFKLIIRLRKIVYGKLCFKYRIGNLIIIYCCVYSELSGTMVSGSLKVDLIFISPFHFYFILFFIFDLFSIFRTSVRVTRSCCHNIRSHQMTQSKVTWYIEGHRCQDCWQWTLFYFLFSSLFYFSFLFHFHFSIVRTTWVRVYQSRCHISHKLMA